MTGSDLKPKPNPGQAAFPVPEIIRFLGQLPFYMVINDRDSVYVYCSPAYAAEMSKHPKQFIGRSDYDFHPPRITRPKEPLPKAIKRRHHERQSA